MKLGCYKHYRGNEYSVFGFAHNPDTREKMVLYRPLYEVTELLAQYDGNVIFVRSYNVFNEMVMIDGIEKPRFEFIDEA